VPRPASRQQADDHETTDDRAPSRRRLDRRSRVLQSRRGHKSEHAPDRATLARLAFPR
jgi:hypothetical protein